MSEPSSAAETERFRFFKFFKLEEEKFFLSPVLDWALPGEPDRGRDVPFSLSLFAIRLKLGVGGETVSDELGPGNGEEACRVNSGTGGRLGAMPTAWRD